ncbi:MAG TPA: MFS transporter [Bryobacteraceae bacterium]|nr:MFS transporter [Bryobacteraceae bacterium]
MLDTGAATGIRHRTRVRVYVLAAIFLLSFITIVDRVCISSAKAAMSQELGIGNLDFGAVFGAFALGYALFMVPSGWFADRYGPRLFLTAVVVIWSIFTITTGLVRTVMPLIVLRFLFGMAEAGAYPTATRAIYNWFPVRERGLALGLLNTGSRLGAAIGLFIMSLSVAHLGWRMSFWVLGVLGIAWAVFWYLWFRDNPATKSGINALELDYIRSGSPAHATADTPPPKATWSDFFGSRNFYLLLFQYFASNFTFFICFSWLLPYAQERYRLTPAEAGFYASIPLYCGAMATWLSGLAVDAIYKRGHWKLSRALPAACGFGLAAICLLFAGSLDSVLAFVVCFGIATFGVDLTLSPSWTASSDIGWHYTGTLSAAMNTMGSLGSFASSLAFPWLLKTTGTVEVYFYAAAIFNVIAILCWIGLRPDRPLIASHSE